MLAAAVQYRDGRIDYDSLMVAAEHELGGSDLTEWPPALQAALQERQLIPVDLERAIATHRGEALAQNGEGWDLFEWGTSNLFEIQVDTDVEPAKFPLNTDAVAFVERKAAEGSQRHRDALEAHRRDVPELTRRRDGENLHDVPRRG